MTITPMKTLALATAMSFAAPLAIAQSGSPEASTEGEVEVGSQKQFVYDTNSPRINNGMAEFDEKSIAMPLDTFRALANSRGEMMQTTAGDNVGEITEVDYNAKGNPELRVDVKSKSAIQADVLVVTVTPDNVMMKDGAVYLDTTVDELELKARKNSTEGSDGKVSVTL